MLTAFGSDMPPKSNYDCRWAKMSDGTQQFLCQEWPQSGTKIMPYLTAALVGIGIGLAVLSTRGK